MPAFTSTLGYPDAQTESAAFVFEVPSNESGRAPVELLGIAACETTGSAAASFRLHDGTSDSDPILLPLFALSSAQSTTSEFSNGVQIESGALSGSRSYQDRSKSRCSGDRCAVPKTSMQP